MDSPVRLTWELSRAAEVTGDGLRLILMARLAAPANPDSRRAPLNISLVLDRSGSMAGDKIQQCIHAARYGVSQLAATDQASVVIFDDRVDILVPHGPVQKDRIMGLLGQVTSRGSTNLSGGWLQGASVVESAAAAGRVSRVLLLTDGEANQGVIEPSRLCELAQDISRKGVQTTTIGFGAGFNEDLLRGMADAGGGNFHFIATAEEAPVVFAQEFRELLQIVAQNIRLQVVPSAHVRLVGTLQEFPTRPIPGGLEIVVGDLAAGDQKCVLVELHVPSDQVDKGGVSVMHLSFQQVVGEVAFRELSAFVEVPPGSLAETPMNPVVWREVVISEVGRELKAAQQEADGGRLDEARTRLQNMRDRMQGSEWRDDAAYVEQIQQLDRIEKLLQHRQDYSTARKYMSSASFTSSRSVVIKGLFLGPAVHAVLQSASRVVFVISRELAIQDGLPDPHSELFEGVPGYQLQGAVHGSVEAARQWRWIQARQEAVTRLCGHKALPSLEALKRYAHRWPETSLVTTATDGLHARHAPGYGVVELLGSIWQGRCPVDGLLHDLQDEPWCDDIPVGPCGHALQPGIVWPGTAMPQEVWDTARERLGAADAVIVVGRPSDVLVEPIRRAGLVISLSEGEQPEWATAHINMPPVGGLYCLSVNPHARPHD